MSPVAQLKTLTPVQRNAFIASFLGWMLDAFDFFVLIFVISDIAKEFHVKNSDVSFAIMLTLAFRPLGALAFGWAADRYGRRTPLMINVICYSIISLLCGFAPTLTIFLCLRALFGIAMGGEWGLGASLAMESVPAETRGLLSGILQEGYVVGNLLAAVAYAVISPRFGWRAMFFVGALPALLSLFIRSRVQESPVWEQQRRARETKAASAETGGDMRKHAGLFLYLVALMTAFTFMSHGTQDIYPLFLKEQHKFSPHTVSFISIISNFGALTGGIFFGSLSQRIGRRKAIILAALLALPMIPLWAFSPTAALLAVGAFLMQFMVQGAWGVIPAHLSELAPNAMRGTFAGLAYQLGNLLSSVNGPLQTRLAERNENNYGGALAGVIVIALLCVAGVTAAGREARDVDFAE